MNGGGDPALKGVVRGRVLALKGVAGGINLVLASNTGGRDLGTQVVSSVSSRHLVPRPPSPPANSLSREDLNQPFQNHP